MTRALDAHRQRDLEGALARLGALEEELRKRTAEADAAQTRYDELLEAFPLPYLVTDVAGTIRDANDAAAGLAATALRFLVGKPLVAFVRSEDRAALRHALLDLRGGRASSHRFCLRDRNGILHDVVARITPTRDGTAFRWLLLDAADGDTGAAGLRLEAAVRERTAELVTAARSLQHDRTLLAAALERLPIGIVVIDATTRRPLVVNPALEELVGTDSLNAPPWDAPLRRALAGEVVREDARVRVAGGGTRRVEIRAEPVRDPYGGVDAVVASFDDLTQRSRREEAERDFVANAAHSLQTPLAAITSAVEVLQAGAKDVPAERDRFLAHLERNAQRLVRLSRALLVLARVQALGERPRTNVVALEPLLRSLADSAAAGRSATVTVTCPGDLSVVANRELLEEALANLVDNAAKHGGGNVTVDVRLRASDGRAVVVVANDGEGIPPEASDGIFVRFARAGDAEGTGLGLAIVKEAVDALGGEVSFRSTDGRTTFRVVLIAAREIV